MAGSTKTPCEAKLAQSTIGTLWAPIAMALALSDVGYCAMGRPTNMLRASLINKRSRQLFADV